MLPKRIHVLLVNGGDALRMMLHGFYILVVTRIGVVADKLEDLLCHLLVWQVLFLAPCREDVSREDSEKESDKDPGRIHAVHELNHLGEDCN